MDVQHIFVEETSYTSSVAFKFLRLTDAGSSITLKPNVAEALKASVHIGAHGIWVTVIQAKFTLIHI